VAGGLFLLGGLVQINPIWLWGPYHPYIGENGAQPDWYLGWLIGALRMMPNWEPTIAGRTIVPNPFWGGAFFPLLVFGILYAWPLLERRVSGDRATHHLLERPRDNPRRTGWGVALFTFTAIPFFAGSMDRVYLRFGFPYQNAVRFMQWTWVILPPVLGYAAFRIARTLRDGELRPLRGVTARMVERRADGGLVAGQALLANPSWTPEAAPSPPRPRDRGLRELVVDALRETSTLARAEARGLAARLAVAARRSLLGAAAIAMALVLVLAAVGALAVAATLAIASVLPAWLAAVVVAVAASLGGLLAFAAVARGRR
jgi:Putative Actinobacterial Holin-X, holin superfamily III